MVKKKFNFNPIASISSFFSFLLTVILIFIIIAVLVKFSIIKLPENISGLIPNWLNLNPFEFSIKPTTTTTIPSNTPTTTLRPTTTTTTISSSKNTWLCCKSRSGYGCYENKCPLLWFEVASYKTSLLCSANCKATVTTTTVKPTTTTVQSATTTTLNTWCSDTDGGKDYYTKGTASDYWHANAMTDYCSGDDQLYEYYCGADKKFTFELKDCYYGCKDGACYQYNHDCTDSDGGNYPLTAGDTYQGSSVYYDSCSGNYLTEYYCSGRFTISSSVTLCSGGCNMAWYSGKYLGKCLPVVPTTTTTTTLSPWINNCEKECSSSGRGYKFCVSQDWISGCRANSGILLPSGDYGCSSGMKCCCAWKNLADACNSYGHSSYGCLDLSSPYANCEIQGGGTGVLVPDGNYLCSSGFSLCCYN